MFWKKKTLQKQEQKNKSKTKNNSFSCELPVSERRTRHVKAIIDGKLYDTEKAEFISFTEDHRALFVTKKRNYFSCNTLSCNYTKYQENKTFNVFETTYYDIRPESIEYVMSNIGKYEPEKYIELFGEVEEA